MSKYTMQLRQVEAVIGHDELLKIFTSYNLNDYLTQDEINDINLRGTWNKMKLGEKIIKYYYTREIGFETIGLFKFEIKNAMEEIMEEYLPLIYSASIKYDPLVNVDFTETYDRNSEDTSNSSSNSNSDSSSLVVNSDTPQGQINKQDILNGNYASSTSADESEASNQTTTNGNNIGNEHYTRKTKGNSGVSATAQKMIEQYRDNIRALDREIIHKLNDCFMILY